MSTGSIPLLKSAPEPDQLAEPSHDGVELELAAAVGEALPEQAEGV